VVPRLADMPLSLRTKVDEPTGTGIPPPSTSVSRNTGLVECSAVLLAAGVAVARPSSIAVTMAMALCVARGSCCRISCLLLCGHVVGRMLPVTRNRLFGRMPHSGVVNWSNRGARASHASRVCSVFDVWMVMTVLLS